MTDGWKILIVATSASVVCGAIVAVKANEASTENYERLNRRVYAVEQPVCSPMMEIAKEGIVGCVISVVGDTSVFRACYSRQEAINIPSSHIRPTKFTCADAPHPEAR